MMELLKEYWRELLVFAAFLVLCIVAASCADDAGRVRLGCEYRVVIRSSEAE